MKKSRRPSDLNQSELEAILEAKMSEIELLTQDYEERLAQELRKSAALKKKLEETTASDVAPAEATKALSLRFCLSPAELHATESLGDPSRLSGVSFTHMSLEGEAVKQRAVSIEGAELERMDAQLLLRSVGYRSVELDGLPWNESWCARCPVTVR